MMIVELTIPPGSVQLLATRQFTIAEVVRIFAVPAHMIARDQRGLR